MNWLNPFVLSLVILECFPFVTDESICYFSYEDNSLSQLFKRKLSIQLYHK